ncbi:hypothetical protein NQ317_004043 [Molorchus minor]|uniref:UDP-N-acetylglucosamine transferase subunit ALG14 n=1 Tax=Molorchus minor TaxID=1323400 RepID=A0ABQ9JVK8_9CUCU|nr:hypothetical protein NQ317_004043 [Molorchus minor]
MNDYFCHSKYSNNKRKPSTIIICVGSGGHTTEMLKLTEHTTKVEEFEKIKGKPNYKIYKIPRSRVVSQSYFTSIFSTLFSVMYSIPLILKNSTRSSFMQWTWNMHSYILLLSIDTKIVFIESFCRTKTFSLTGKILTYIADNFLVQWPGLKEN